MKGAGRHDDNGGANGKNPEAKDLSIETEVAEASAAVDKERGSGKSSRHKRRAAVAVPPCFAAMTTERRSAAGR